MNSNLTRLELLPFLLLLGCRTVPPPAAESPAGDDVEVTRLCAEDQADRQPQPGEAIDWKAVGPRDAARLARIKELYRAGSLHSGPDFHHAALVLQHGNDPEDFLLAHELCVVAVAKGEQDALWLCAASEDRFLMNIARPQRFATQYRSDKPGEPMHLYQVGEGVTDELRAAFRTPSLKQAREREELINSLSGHKH
jgi:hypothetical protein